ncbi:MAG: sulfatase [Planctomycetales bacterium]|nr:sulfatase [Planctomycetales bacterium]
MLLSSQRGLLLLLLVFTEAWISTGKPVLAATAAKAQPPNLVVIVVDDLGWTDAACLGSTFYETPAIDRLASQSMQFTNAYAACPVCSPTRASLQTGRYPARLATTEWFGGAQPDEALSEALRQQFRHRRLLPAPYRDSLPLDETTLAEALQTAGYHSFYVGKWHLGKRGYWPQDQGYEVNLGGGAMGWPRGGYFSPYHNPQLEDGPEGEHLPERLSRESIRLIEEHRQEPFMLFLSFYSVHTPLEARDDLAAKYRKKAQRTTTSGPLFLPEGSVHNRQRQDDPVYAAMVEAVDEAVGDVLTALDRLGLDDNTLVVFTSDNGGLSTAEGSPTSNLPLRAGKGWLYEGGIRIPWLVRWPGETRAGSKCDTPVITNDLYFTLLEAAGLKAPEEPAADGLSLVPLLNSESGFSDRSLYWHYPHYSNQGGRPGGAVRHGPWKLIEWYGDGSSELYRLDRDPGERQNLVKAQPKVALELRKEITAWRDAVGARMPTPNPGYRPRREE